MSIDDEELESIAFNLNKNSYGQYLIRLYKRKINFKKNGTVFRHKIIFAIVQ